MTESSNTCDSHGSSDPRNCVGYALQTLSVGDRGRYLPDGNAVLLLVGMSVALSDVCAFVLGNALGGPRLAPRLSPNKTLAGVAGNVIGAYLALGITLLIATQTLVNLGVVTGLLPTKGLPLPFISFGGSALSMTMVSTGVLLNISQHAHV